MVKIKLGKSTRDPNTIRKRGDNSIFTKTMEGTFRETHSLLEPTVTMEFNSRQKWDYNYAKIEYEGGGGVIVDYNYYYIVDWEITTDGLIKLQLKMDVLNTYRDYVMKLNVKLERSSLKRNSYGNSHTSHLNNLFLPDAYRQMELPYKTEVMEFPRGFSDREEDGTYVLITAQNGYAPV